MLKPKKLPSGNWNVMVYAGTENGKRKYKSITAATRNEVLFLAAEWKLKRPGKGQMTLRDAYTQYCDTRRNVLSASTMREYARITKRSDYPIMDMSIDSITTHDVQNAVNSMARDHSAKTVRNHHGLFSAVMSAYRPDAKFSVSLPKNKTQEVYIPEPETIKRLYTLLLGNWLFVPFILASQCGLRASEVAGLQYKHVTPGKLLIRQAKVAGEFGETLKDTKTDSGKRDIRCSPEVIKLLGTGEPDQYVVPHSAFQISDGWGDFMRSHPEEKYFTYHKLRHSVGPGRVRGSACRRWKHLLFRNARQNARRDFENDCKIRGRRHFPTGSSPVSRIFTKTPCLRGFPYAIRVFGDFYL